MEPSETAAEGEQDKEKNRLKERRKREGGKRSGGGRGMEESIARSVH